MVATIDIDAQMEWLEGQVGFLEGPNNENPYGPWQGVWNAAYCCSFAQEGACEAGGYRWPQHCQFGWKGDAYVPFAEAHARELGLWRGPENRPGRGDQPVYDWTGWGGGDHIGGGVWGTDDGWKTVWVVEANTGSPQGVHWVRRDWTFIRGFVVMSEAAGGGGGEPPPPSGPRDLRRGLSGDDVTALQQRLSDLGYDVPGGVDGDFGTGTEQAVLNFQFDWLPSGRDGIVGVDTRAALADDAHRADMHNPPAPPADPPFPPWPGRYLRRGDTGDDVATAQTRLKERGWDITVDGWFGRKTERVVRSFEENKNLEVDGIIGPDFWSALWLEPII